jgi:4-hydroxy-tetrahydrodipicolinate reductase
MKAVIYGFGQIGRLIAESCLKKGFEIVGAVDTNPELRGKTLSEFGLDCDAPIKDSLDFEGDIVFLSTGSFVDHVYPQIEDCLNAGFNVVSTCETLSYPEYRYPELAKKIDEIAKEKNLTVLGSGINPGFLLDSLIVALAAPNVTVESIRAVRSIDALKRRPAFRKKVGIGLEVDEVKRLIEENKITGHVGFAESVLLICESMNLKPDAVVEGQEIAISDGSVVPEGKAAGMIGWAIAEKDGVERVRIEFHAVAGVEEYEEIEIKGDNEIRWRSTGTKGDLGTAALMTNLAETVVNWMPGLIKMSDIIPFKPTFSKV